MDYSIWLVETVVRFLGLFMLVVSLFLDFMRCCYYLALTARMGMGYLFFLSRFFLKVEEGLCIYYSAELL